MPSSTTIPAPMCIVVIGLSGAGKSTSLAWIARHYNAARVRRFTTRERRFDDDHGLVWYVNNVEPDPDSFIYEGWSNTRYCVRESDVFALHAAMVTPLVELGDPDDAIRFKTRFHPARIVLVRRTISAMHLSEMLRERGLAHEQSAHRLETLDRDCGNIEQNLSTYDYVVCNDGTLMNLYSQWKTILKSCNVMPR